MQKRSLFSLPFRHKNAETLRIIPDPERFSSVFYSARAHTNFTAVPQAMTSVPYSVTFEVV